MSRSLALAAGLLASISADTCSKNGFPAEFERTGILVNFVDSILTCNNLGGIGPDEDCPREIRYSYIGFNYGTSTGDEDDIPIDLVVTNVTEYRANNPARNGLTQDQTGELGQINVRDGWATGFKYSFVISGGDADNPADAIVFSTPFQFFYYDIDYGESQRMIESMRFDGVATPPGVTSIVEACIEQGQPAPCLTTTVIIENLGVDSNGTAVFSATANDRGVGADNAESPSQILKPVAEMNDFERLAATRYVNVTFPANVSSFVAFYEVTPSAELGSSGRNFQFSVIGGGVERVILYSPCFYCDNQTYGKAWQCEPCGLQVEGLEKECAFGSDVLAYPPACDIMAAVGCIPGNSSYPACLERCAAKCEQEGGCAEYLCYDDRCKLCGEPKDHCAMGSKCYDKCGKGNSFPTKDDCLNGNVFPARHPLFGSFPIDVCVPFE